MKWIPSISGIAIVILLLGDCLLLQGQSVDPQGWINTGQPYLKISVSKTGFYRITSKELVLAGIEVSDLPMANYRLYRRGRECPLQITETDSGRLSDLVFYGERNDGANDISLYTSPTAMPHAYYSLYSDTASYFLSWHPVPTPALRIRQEPLYHIQEALDFHFEQSLQLFNSHYPAGQFYPAESSYPTGSVRTAYDTGEGWTGPAIDPSTGQTLTLALNQAVNSRFQLSQVKVMMVGLGAGYHQVDFYMGSGPTPGRFLGQLDWANYETATFQTTLLPEDIGADNKIVLMAFPLSGSTSISYVQWSYPQYSHLQDSTAQKTLYFQQSAAFNWQVIADSTWTYYSIGEGGEVSKLQAGPTGIATHSRQIVAVRKFMKIAHIQKVVFDPIDYVAADYLIITHPSLRKPIAGTDPVRAYADYRASAPGGHFHPLVMDIQEVFDRFNYGESSPLAIRQLIGWLAERSPLKYVFLIGKSIDPQTARKLAQPRNIDMIPNAGWPGSDIALSMNLNGSGTFIPLIPIGRLNTDQSQSVMDYLQKVVALESEKKAASWRKRILHLSGGRSRAEISVFREYVDRFAEILHQSNLAPQIETLSKVSERAVEQIAIDGPINQGVALVTMFGHTGLNQTDLDIGFATDARRHYQNAPYYPALLVNGCATGNIFYREKTITNDWILAPEKGAVLAIAHTHNGRTTSLRRYSQSFYEVLADSNFNSQGFGDIQKEAISRYMNRNSSIYDGITAEQMNLQGDPAIAIFPAQKADYTWYNHRMTITDERGNQPTTYSDSLVLRVSLANFGRLNPDSVAISVSRTSTRQAVFHHHSRYHLSRNAQTLMIRIPNVFTEAGLESWELTIDPENLIDEENEDNNRFTFPLYLPFGGATPLLPTTGFSTNRTQVDLIAQAPHDQADGTVVFQWANDSSFTKNPHIQSIVAKARLADCRIQLPPGSLTYWRVWMNGDVGRPSPPRAIHHDPGIDAPPQPPEIMALAKSKTTSSLLEGGTFTTTVEFLNISPTSFSDSVSISTTVRNDDRIEEMIQIIAPIKGNERITYPVGYQSLGRVGLNEVTVTCNSTYLPEAYFHNNTQEFSFEVIPDGVPPTLQIWLDGQIPVNGGPVAPGAELLIALRDNNNSLPLTDTTAILLWLQKDCPNCFRQRVYFNEASWERLPNGTLLIRLHLPTTLDEGSYYLLASTKDQSQNWAQDYEIYFRVQQSWRLQSFQVSPNPSKTLFFFEMIMEGTWEPAPFHLHIQDIWGRSIAHFTQKIHVGSNRLVWEPGYRPTGIYLYKFYPADTSRPWPGFPRVGRLLYLP
ncbi:peptidase C25-like protein [Dyadobacter jejuensis]|uniref:Peptidase C25-like protein n=1 Tax=Dyadobacter jejuensis TaxID=1082580 RepID=A0A316ASF9_9BACT|nr:C25 family cysteine peptidase [Dyadobacter jejuensis]PWJ60184.1 peptidase C25-like protein [Dyadobacter jejuensis]